MAACCTLSFCVKPGKPCLEILVRNGEIWFKGKDIAEILLFKKYRRALELHVDNEDKMRLSELLKGSPNLGPLKNQQPNTIFINESGLYSLIFGSTKPEAKKFKQWVTKEVLPSLRKYGTYSLNTNFISFTPSYDVNDLVQFYNKNVLYIGYIGTKNNEQLMKFGKSGDFETRFCGGVGCEDSRSAGAV